MWIWQEARELVKLIYQDFKGCKDFGFRGQIQDSGVSILNNISEGFERSTNTEFARFLEIAKGSAGEVRSMYYLAEDLSYVTADNAGERRKKAKKLSVGIAKLTKNIRAKKDE